MPPIPASPTMKIVIGLFGPLSGPLIAYGIDPVNAAKMVYDDINAKGGINGRPRSVSSSRTTSAPATTSSPW